MNEDRFELSLASDAFAGTHGQLDSATGTELKLRFFCYYID